jgi:hypothetical protein
MEQVLTASQTIFIVKIKVVICAQIAHGTPMNLFASILLPPALSMRVVILLMGK